jgi:diguanylate cyclase (GGDEF)-like protein
MTLVASQPSESGHCHGSPTIQHTVRDLDRKDWWNAILVIMLPMGLTAIIALPAILGVADVIPRQDLNLVVHGLLGLVLLFNIYTLYQRCLLIRMRKALSHQLEIATEQRVRAETLYELAILDPLTGLYNRRFSEERLRSEITRAQRHGEPLIVIAMDLNNFKTINDRYGHSAGDLVLKEFARRLGKASRGSDIAVRLGGDEFLLVLPECPLEKVDVVLSRLKDFEITLEHNRIPVSSSCGWAQYEADDTVEELIRRADLALYAQKAMRSSPVPPGLVNT